ncbi:hypothetical protein B0H14DRAFT_3742152 [Mycena olivaceomarginata]|nr:hypothetical protein B0H14DRAFT_3742152 [Mycena olivaceomarginata]
MNNSAFYTSNFFPATIVSSLAVQFAKGASLNTTLLVDRSRRKAADSYLFTGREADQHDLESIHALGANGFLQLTTLNPAFREFEDPLFSDGLRDTDRTFLSTEAITQLGLGISGFLSLLAGSLCDGGADRKGSRMAVSYRCRINEFNVEPILALFLPYHESPHFAKMLSILHINKPSSNLSSSHHTLLAFNAATIHDYLTRTKTPDEGTAAHLLPALGHHRGCHPRELHPALCTGTGMPARPGSFENYHQRDGQLCAPGCRQPIPQSRGLFSVCEAQNPLNTLTDGQAEASCGSSSASASETGVGSVVASMSADEHARTAEVKELVASAQDAFFQPIRAALVPRVQDTSAIVLNALYAAPAALLPVFLVAPKPYLDSLAAALAGKPKHPLLRLHLGFLLGHFCSAATPEAQEDVFYRILFTFLPFSKAWQHTADLVWELIAQSPLVQYDLLAGCAEVWAAEKGNGKEEDEGEDGREKGFGLGRSESVAQTQEWCEAEGQRTYAPSDEFMDCLL